jgi:hypothetical protein
VTERTGDRARSGDPGTGSPESTGCPAEDLPRVPKPPSGEIRWTPEAEARLRRAPVFLRGMVRRLAERRARAEGFGVITPELMTRYKDEMMGMAARGDSPASPVTWTPDAQALLAAVPEFMRPITRRICEELVAEQGATRITAALIHEAEAQAEAEAGGEPVAWAPAAETLLLARLERTPAMMADFVLRLVKRDVEVEARRAGERQVTPERVARALAAGGEEPVRWAPEAWARLQTAPEFVRAGIQKAAERRARRMGLGEITSPALTRFRNQAMMKAVKRIRELGFTELTFEAFDAAAAEIRTVTLNPEAQERLETIRRYFTTERPGVPGDLLGPDLMGRFRAYLHDPTAAPLDPSDE